MDRNHVITTLRIHEADLHRAGVARLYLFGSVARQEAGPDSDVDLFFNSDNPRFSFIQCFASGLKRTRCACSDVLPASYLTLFLAAQEIASSAPFDDSGLFPSTPRGTLVFDFLLSRSGSH